EELKKELLARCFRGWPEKAPPIALNEACDITRGDVRARAFDFTSEQEVEPQLWVFTRERTDKGPHGIRVSVLGQKEWGVWAGRLGLPSGAVSREKPPALNDKGLEMIDAALKATGCGQVFVVPRGVGPTRYGGAGTPAETHLKRRFALLGQTLDGQRVWDVRR